jgi:hypothetical protein
VYFTRQASNAKTAEGVKTTNGANKTALKHYVHLIHDDWRIEINNYELGTSLNVIMTN